MDTQELRASSVVSQGFQLYSARVSVRHRQLILPSRSLIVRNRGDWPLSGNRNLTRVDNVMA
jgi:hypothetical protein